MLSQNEINKGVQLCTAAASNERKNKIAIYTYGKGIEIVSEEFETDRIYYHGEGGKKMFFNLICFSEPNGHVTMLN